jgi:uncharacterized protein YaaW (UPF0174 family)
MPVLLICYDLRKPNYTEEDYEDLIDALKKLKAKHIQESVWSVRSESTSEEIHDQLETHLHFTDRLLVADIVGFTSTNGMTKLSSA